MTITKSKIQMHTPMAKVGTARCRISRSSVRPDDLLQFAFHFAEPLTAASFLTFCHNVYTPFLIIRDRLLVSV